MYTKLYKIKSFFFIIYFITFNNISFSQQRIKIAVFPFKYSCANFNYKNICDGLPDMLMTDLSQSGKIIVVERVQIDKALLNFQIEQSGMIDDQTAVKIGKWVGANAIILGNFAGIDQEIRIDVRIINVETGELLSSTKVYGNGKDFFGLIDNLSSKILNNFTGEDISFDNNKILMNESFVISKDDYYRNRRISGQEYLLFNYKDKYDNKYDFKIYGTYTIDNERIQGIFETKIGNEYIRGYQIHMYDYLGQGAIGEFIYIPCYDFQKDHKNVIWHEGTYITEYDNWKVTFTLRNLLTDQAWIGKPLDRQQVINSAILQVVIEKL